MRKKLQDIKDLPPFDAGIDSVDNYWYLIMYLRDLIKASEIKAGLVLSFYGLLMNVFFQFYEHLIELAINDYLTYGFMGLWFLFSVISIYFSFRCFMPQIETNYDKSVFFFGDIISSYGPIKEYVKELEEVNTQRRPLFDQLGEQVYINAKITAAKFKNVNLSVRYLAYNIGLVFVFILYYAIKTAF
ncbi:DUF5706 domain-containing protein [Algoriphagus halophytocola]|uniref:DUF5706 domain-containing protein n=1 Tax=Algoriphagus halophytocola TaxID=2991499 RepID=A0ABY6MGU7_9BACT|nr:MULTISPECIES: Pycsar system effector family protein [unclassified Algoriphagus]UZD21871.1 DUF5706 domain-containing protein [Algoriphagus sp. TR-M5]WBL43121.1 DUF5706 domain-containing protein [Algoriphagus sp. TR-M9]